MEWNYLLDSTRFGQENKGNDPGTSRSEFERDFDRLIFSSPFRRLQNKTQVFPLPGNIFVHNRLTHSLEVASVGRSLGALAGKKLKEENEIPAEYESQEIGSIVATACLAHDLGNPPFGHSGENAISRYFSKPEAQIIKDQVDEKEWKDLENFEGNANALRVLTHKFKGKRHGGFNLTYATLGALIKYPWESNAMGKSTNERKYGFFCEEKETFKLISDRLKIPYSEKNSIVGTRHPLVFLMEAADDICYLIIDLEDAHRLGVISFEICMDLLLLFFNDNPKQRNEVDKTLNSLDDKNEKIAYLRARAINVLVMETAAKFWEEHDRIMNGDLQKSLVKILSANSMSALAKIREFSNEHIYNSRRVVEIELAGFNVLGGLMEEFIPAVTQNSNERYHQKLREIIPEQFEVNNGNVYQNVLSVLDFISGMTDIFAVDLYRKIRGISFQTI